MHVALKFFRRFPSGRFYFLTIAAALLQCSQLAITAPVSAADDAPSSTKIGAVVPSASTVAASSKFEFKTGDRVSILGNTLADRMQHHGWLETLLQNRLPKHQLSVRNLGFSGDELTLRLRSANFGSPEEWLRRTEADVVFAMFGYNESYAGAAGLDKFKQDLDAFVKQTLSQKYNGESAARLVLFSPIAHEDLANRNLPDGKENNARLKLYTEAMAQVAAANQVSFVDLFSATQKLYDNSEKPLTINGVHLNEYGDKLLAQEIATALFSGHNAAGGTAVKPDAKQLEKLRQAVLDKNFHWFQRYRTTDGFSIYGGRADLKFVGGQTNRVVMQREMEVLDVMTANRDKRIWAVAAGDDLQLDDANTPAFLEVISNKQGPLPGGKHVFLSADEVIGTMTVAKNMKVNVFASEAMFPELVNPVQMAFDTKGRLWVAAWRTYPHWQPKEPMDDKLLILEDTDGDGRADKRTVFAGNLHNPTGFEFWNGGVLIAQQPDVLFLKDTDGDDKADYREQVINGIDSADTHHAANSFVLDPGGALYFQEGTFHHTQIETPWGPTVRNANAGAYRYEPRTQKLDVFVAYGFANPHGHAFDAWGQSIMVDGTGAVPYHTALFSGRTEFPQKHGRPPTVYQQRTRPCAAIEILSSKHFPDENQGNLLVNNVIGMQGILQYKLSDKGGSLSGTEVEPIVSSTDPNFRPADVEVGPDGAIYFTDWHNPIIGHMQHNLRDPNRNRNHGRVYRVTYEGRPLSKPAKIADQPIEALLDLLKEPEDRVRYRTRIELTGRKTKDVLPAVERWVAALDKQDSRYEHHMLEALWLYQSHNEVNTALLERMLSSSDFRARAAATRVLCYWRDRVSNSLDLLKRLAADPHPRVRVEAVRAASFFDLPEAVEVPIIAADQSPDTYVDFVRSETMKTLDPIWKKALADGRQVAFTTDVGARYLLRNVSTEQLLKSDRNRSVYLEMLSRAGLQDAQRREAVVGLAKLAKTSELQVLIDTIQSLDAKQNDVEASVLFDLVRLLTSRNANELSAARAELEKMATSAKQPLFRQIGYVALINVDKSVDKAWELAGKSVESLSDLVSAMPLISDSSVRASLYPKIEPLLAGLPSHLATSVESSVGPKGRFVRIELPTKKGTLTLAEVEVFSTDGLVSRQGKATQINTQGDANASRALDGNKSGEFSANGQTHTQENIANPWWEVDLGAEMPIDRILIYNRTDGELGKRLDNFTVRVLSKDRKEVFRKDKNPAPKNSVALKLGTSDPAIELRRLSMNALTQVRGQEARTFQSLAKFVRDGSVGNSANGNSADRNSGDRTAAIRALQKIPRAEWAKADAKPLLDTVVADLRKTAAADRTSPEALDAMEFAHALTTLLPASDAKRARAELNDLGVRVIRVGTLFERMAFDKDVIAVRAGKPVEFVFENTDLMPHNFVITEIGALEEIGMTAEETAQLPDAAKRHFVPKSNKVLLASKLLQPREIEKLSFVAPTKPGIYPYVCTYPGHWRKMYGALYVVADLDAYLENPESYLAANSLEIKDELLKDRRERTEWKFEDLAAAMSDQSQSHGRSYGNGKQIFTVASCAACHKMDGVGYEIGPDLTKLEAKWTSVDILKEILDPSAKINEKFQTYTFLLDSGKSVTGLILEETPESIKVIENPLVKAEPIVIKPSEVEMRTKSAASIMPKGLLDKLTRDEILDLLSYVSARGKQESAKANGAHSH